MRTLQGLFSYIFAEGRLTAAAWTVSGPANWLYAASALSIVLGTTGCAMTAPVAAVLAILVIVPFHGDSFV